MVCFHGPCQAGGISKVGGDPIDRNCNSSPGSAGRTINSGHDGAELPDRNDLPSLATGLDGRGGRSSGIQAGQPIATPCFRVFDREGPGSLVKQA
jgi:hypothetical protein